MANILQNYIKFVIQHKTHQQEADNLAKNVRVQHRAQDYPLFTVYLLELHVSDKLRTDYKITFVHCAKLFCFNMVSVLLHKRFKAIIFITML